MIPDKEDELPFADVVLVLRAFNQFARSLNGIQQPGDITGMVISWSTCLAAGNNNRGLNAPGEIRPDLCCVGIIGEGCLGITALSESRPFGGPAGRCGNPGTLKRDGPHFYCPFHLNIPGIDHNAVCPGPH